MLKLKDIDNINLEYLNFYQTYSVLLSFEEGNCEKGASEAACFSRAYNAIHDLDDQKEQIAKRIVLVENVCIDPKGNAMSIDNFVPLTNFQVKAYITQLQTLFKQYNLKSYIVPTKIKYNNTDCDFLEITIEAENIPAFYAKWILAYIRYMSETPCNWVLKETFIIRRLIPKLKKFPIISVFMFLWSNRKSTHALTVDTTDHIVIPKTLKFLKSYLATCPKPYQYIDDWFISCYGKVKMPKAYLEKLPVSHLDYRRSYNKNYIRNILKGIIPEDTLKMYKDFLFVVKPLIK